MATLVCPKCRREGRGDGAVVQTAVGPQCVCGWSRRTATLPRRRRKGRTTSAVALYGRVVRAPAEKTWEPLTPPEPVETPTDDGELSLSAPEPVERGRVEKIRAGILATLREQGRMTRDRLGELLLPELPPELARRHITPRVDELITEQLVRETAQKGLTRSGREAWMVEVVE